MFGSLFRNEDIVNYITTMGVGRGWIAVVIDECGPNDVSARTSRYDDSSWHATSLSVSITKRGAGVIDGLDDVSVSIESDIPFVLAAGNRVGATGCRWRREMPSGGGKKIFNSVKVNNIATSVQLFSYYVDLSSWSHRFLIWHAFNWPTTSRLLQARILVIYIYI